MKILDKNNKILRKVAQEIKDINSPKIRKVIRDMHSTLSQHDDGVAIAAPQIGSSLNLFILSPKFFPHEKNLIYINPRITHASRKKVVLDEGCLSVRWFYGKTRRSEKVTIEAQDEGGREFTRGSTGLLAQVFQHETDHLNGILFIDHATDIQEVKHENRVLRDR